jgi:uncharacterized protein
MKARQIFQVWFASFALLGLLATKAAHAQDGEPVAVPPLETRITDLTGTLTPATKTEIETLIAEFEERKGSQVAVLILPTTGPEDIAQYSIRVAEAWKLGRAGVDDGVLFLIAVQDRTMRIEVGYGLEGALTDIQSKQIISDQVTPYFRASDFDGGVRIGVQSIIASIENEPLPAPAPGGASNSVFGQISEEAGFYFGTIVVLFGFIASAWMASSSFFNRTGWGLVFAAVTFALGLIFFSPLVSGILAGVELFMILFFPILMSGSSSSSGSGYSSSSSWSGSSSSSSWSSSSSSSSGGGWSGGGGGSFGGGGASGSW